MLSEMKDWGKALWANKYSRYSLYSATLCGSLALFRAYGVELSDVDTINTAIDTGALLSFIVTSAGSTIGAFFTGCGVETYYQLRRTRSEIWKNGGEVPIESVLAYQREAPCGKFGIL